MRITSLTASVIALGALLGGFAASSGAPSTVQHRTVASAQVADTSTVVLPGNNGNG
jgi:hypothetical protein